MLYSEAVFRSFVRAEAILKHADNPSLRVTVSMHNRDMKRRTLESIIKQSELTREQFLDLL
jgi:hypothetical protein